jgi:tRNA threonylcarbamoyladenosine biosynthesis protein TsaB
LRPRLKNCSVSIAKDGKTIICNEIAGRIFSCRTVACFIETTMQQAAITFSDLSAVAVSQGLGSGLRIGVSASKGLLLCVRIPLIAVDTLKS